MEAIKLDQVGPAVVLHKADVPDPEPCPPDLLVEGCRRRGCQSEWKSGGASIHFITAAKRQPTDRFPIAI